MDERYFLGLDLGQSQDFSALVALRRRTEPDPLRPGETRRMYATRGIKRWPLRTPYPAIVADVVSIVGKPPLAGCVLGVDRTGCGQPVVDMLHQRQPEARIKPVLITAGHSASGDGYSVHVPKRELVAAVQLVLQTGRLEIAKTQAEAATLAKELLAFRAKISTSGHETLEADWRQRAHDDLVLALAIAVWLGEKLPDPYTGPIVLNPSVPFGDEKPAAKPEPSADPLAEYLDDGLPHRPTWEEERQAIVQRILDEDDGRDGLPPLMRSW